MIAIGNDMCSAVSVGDAACVGVYVCDGKVFPDAPPAPTYDETKIAVIELDENDEPTENVTYVDTVKAASSFVGDNSGTKWFVRVGSQCSDAAGFTTQRFSYKENLKRVEIYNGTTVISDSCFYGSGLKQIALPDTLTEIQVSAFAGSALESLTMPDSVTTLGNRICGECTALKSVKLSAGLLMVKSQAFQQCTALTSVTIPEGVKAIDNLVFNDCTALTAITFPTSIAMISGGAFTGASALETITIPLPEHSFYGEPWGATNATVVWTG